MTKPNFVHLHVHSHYSLLDGLGKIKQLVEKAKALGMPALALTDHGVMHGAIEFYLECQSNGVKPIVGVEAYISPRRLTDKTPGTDNRSYHLLLLAKNMTGYLNLIKLTSIAHMEGYYYKPRIDWDTLTRYKEGIIVSTACIGSQTSRQILDHDFKGLEKTANEYSELFGKDHYYIELQHHPSIPEQQVINQRLRDLAEKLKLPMIITNDAHYINAEDAKTHDILVCIQTGKLLSDASRMVYSGDFSLKDPSDMLAAFPDLPSAIENTVRIADMVNLKIPLDESLLPKFPLPEGETEESLLRKLCEQGLKHRYQNITPEIRQRLDYELDVVSKTGYPGYFLIVADMVKFARNSGIFVGPGRGSAAGSLVAYVTDITNIDPISYNLVFERFLNPERISMPDIDIDFEDDRRGEVIEYVAEKYGRDHVAGIITFGTIMARAAVRDVGRVLGVPYAKVDSIAKTIPPPQQGRHVPLAKSIKDSPELAEIYKKDPEAKQVLEQAIKLEGTVRHASQHACAIVISKEPLDRYVAVQMAQGGDVHQVTQYAMGPIEKIGLLKMDFLGLANLTIMRQACEIIEAVHGAKINIDTLPLDDKKTFQLLGKGETTGVFQLESAGMKRYLKELQPSEFEDIMSMVALYRPGPIDSIPAFIESKHGRRDITYLHPSLKSILESTYGVIVTQDQVLKIARVFSGFTYGQADILRKAVGKKIKKLLDEQKEKFIQGAVETSKVKRELADQVWDFIAPFAAYGFNRAHAACYAMIAYQTAYLKAYYPDCFMAALMTSDLDNLERLTIEITECERLGLTVLPPDVNESFSDFAVVKDKNAIRFGLGAIKNVGASVAKVIVRERKANGIYPNLIDFLIRNAGTLNKKVLENLVKSGALDTMASRGDLYGGLELLVKLAADANKHASSDQVGLFGDAKVEMPKLDLPHNELERSEILNWEKELLGLYLSDHPLKEYAEVLQQNATPLSEINIDNSGQVVRVGGIVQTVKKITTKSNQMMAFAQIEDLTGNLEVVFFPTIYSTQADNIVVDRSLLLQGKINNKDGSPKILVDQIWRLDQLKNTQLPPIQEKKNSANWRNETTPKPVKPKIYIIELPKNSNQSTVTKLKSTLEKYPGQVPVELRITSGTATKSILIKTKVDNCEKLDSEIQSLFSA